MSDTIDNNEVIDTDAPTTDDVVGVEDNSYSDVFDMSAEEFAEYENNLDSDNSTDTVDESSVEETTEGSSEVSEETDLETTDEVEDTEETDIEGEDETVDEEDNETEEPTEEDTTVDESDINYQEEYNKIIGSKIKASGKEIVVNNAEEAIKLIQMGANYYKQVSDLKPARKVINLLEENNLMDEDKLSFAIDLLNKNPDAINELVKDVDLSNILTDEESKYTPPKRTVSDAQLAIDDALKAIQHTDTFDRTINTITNDWDTKSRELIQKYPNVIQEINKHMGNGIFETVSTEVERQRMLGMIPESTPDVVAYQQVGDQLYAQQVKSNAPNNGQQNFDTQANAIKKPQTKRTVKNKKAASKPRVAPQKTVSNQLDDIYNMSTEEFEKKYGK